MSTVTFNFSAQLDDKEFVKIEDHLFTTRESLKREEPKVDLISERCLSILKEFEGRLSMKVVREWLLLSKALDQCCGYHSKWDDHKILEELISERDHPFSWYVDNCHIS